MVSPVREWMMGAGAVLLLAAVPVRAGDPPGPRALFPDGHAFRLELARTVEEQARGYMFRERVGRDEGMLFLFPDEGFHSFWMKNCEVSLDILWLSDDLRVVHIEADLPPCRRDPCPGYMSMRKARFVLEIKGGMAGKSGIKVGDLVRLEGVEPAIRPPDR